MIDKIKTIYTGAQSEIIEKKSRFIATVHPVGTEDEAIEFIRRVKKEHYNAAHNCFAYCLGERNQIMRSSDDGEPSGTAGKPILDVLVGQEIHNIVAVVTRYFGGTLLGTGGLVRAYSRAAGEGIKQSVIITKQSGIRITLTIDYNALGKIQYLLASRLIAIIDTQYTDMVTLRIIVPTKETETVEAELIEAAGGKAQIAKEPNKYFALIDGQIHIFD